jgi:hypothetical protein
MEARPPPQIVVVGVQTLGRLALCAFDLRLLELGRDCTHNARRELFLHTKDVLKLPVETVGPQMHTGCGVDELSGDPHTLSVSPYTTFKHIAHAQLAADLLHINRSSLVGEARIARDDE